ncbi:glutamine amidotransferase [Herbaspirillum sp. RV1423]|uniref:glutamine amidotransferase n=1 Tax=Herbaspirillum sp. RV1423 TaxID=1443993 RepID=UPI001E3EB4E1|nr:glutamine amidotransferase [Herbaspirillum sp. RV1423]
MKQSYGSYAVQLQKAAGLADDGTEIVSVFQGQFLREPDRYRAVLITGSPTMVTDLVEWSERTAAWLRRAAEHKLPMFGVCYGHQLLSHAFGGKVGYNPAGRVAGTMTVKKHAVAVDEHLLHEMPESFAAHMLHSQVVLEPPPGATVLASSPMDPHHMLRLAPNIFSAQFHPEFTSDFVKAHLVYYTDVYSKCGIDTAAMCEQVSETPQSAALLRRFLHLHA